MSARWTIVLGILLSAVAGSAHAEFWTGNDLKVRLERFQRVIEGKEVPDPGNEQDTLAAGYVAGVNDAVTGVSVCPPDGVTVGQLVSVVLKFMRANPELLNLTADQVVERSLAAVWPCKHSSPTLPPPRAPEPAKQQPANSKPASDSPF